jgi:hypothetical protein
MDLWDHSAPNCCAKSIFAIAICAKNVRQILFESLFCAEDLSEIHPQIHQWRNAISGGPRFKIFEGPLVEVPKARVERRICTSFLGVQGMLTRKIFESRLSEMRFPGFWRDFTEFWWSENDIVTYQRPWPTFLLYRLSWGPPFGPLGLGAPGFSRSEPIVVTPLKLTLVQNKIFNSAIFFQTWSVTSWSATNGSLVSSQSECWICNSLWQCSQGLPVGFTIDMGFTKWAGHAPPGKFWNSEPLKRHFVHFGVRSWVRFYKIQKIITS